MQDIIERTVSGLGYELVDITLTPGGTLRITIDFPWQGKEEKRTEPEIIQQYITTADCEKVSNQLQYALEVEGVDYKRLEVSSPGLDRELKTERDYWRFQNYQIELTLRQAIADMSNSHVAPNRKKFIGILVRGSNNWQLHWQDEPPLDKKKKNRHSAVAKKDSDTQVINVLEFEFEDVRQAKLVPEISFKKSEQKV